MLPALSVRVIACVGLVENFRDEREVARDDGLLAAPLLVCPMLAPDVADVAVGYEHAFELSLDMLAYRVG